MIPSRGRDLVLDSSCWISWLEGDPERSARVDEVVDRHDGAIAVPALVVFEVDRWMRRNGFDAEERSSVLARLSRERELPIGHREAHTAGRMSAEHGLATADAVILATATLAGCAFATFDRDFESVSGVEVLRSS